MGMFIVLDPSFITLIAGFMLLVVLWLTLQSLWIFLQAVFADLDGEQREDSPSARLRIAALIPAHNEEAGLSATLTSVKAQLAEDDVLLVVADHCDDRTAEIAASFGALVVERHDSSLRGKAYALAAGLRSIEHMSPGIDAVLFIDADCVLGANCVVKLKQAVVSSGQPVQALDLMADLSSTALTPREFAWQFKNWIRPSGSKRLGCPSQLMGTGMLIPRSFLRNVKLGSGALAEDNLLGLHLVSDSCYPQFVPGASVLSHFPEAGKASATQTNRWIHGQLQNQVLLPGLFLKGLTQLNRSKLLFCLDSMVLPMTALLAANLMILLFGALLFLNIGGVVFLLALLSCIFQICSVAVASHKLKAKVFSFSTSRQLLSFIVARLLSVLQFIFAREKQWIRTKR